MPDRDWLNVILADLGQAQEDCHNEGQKDRHEAHEYRHQESQKDRHQGARRTANKKPGGTPTRQNWSPYTVPPWNVTFLSDVLHFKQGSLTTEVGRTEAKSLAFQLQQMGLFAVIFFIRGSHTIFEFLAGTRFHWWFAVIWPLSCQKLKYSMGPPNQQLGDGLCEGFWRCLYPPEFKC